MVIAVNISSLLAVHRDDNNYYLREITTRMARQHPEHTFVFIVNNDFQVSITGRNIELIRAGAGSSHPLRWKWWTDITMLALLKKCRADLLVSTGYGCLRTPIPQRLLLTGPGTEEENSGLTKRQAAFFDKNMIRYLQKEQQVIVFSTTVKQDILNRYKEAAGKTVVVPPFADARFRPLDYTARQQVRERYTGGTEYLLYNGLVHAGKNLLHLLKAFSVFKKKQKTGMKLVFTGTPAADYSSFVKDLQTYRFREDVLFTGPLSVDERVSLTAGAYALVYPSAYEGMAHPVLEALQSGVPVICSPGSAAEEIAGEAALYADPGDFNDTAEKMILLYKDESRRSTLIRDGLAIAGKYDGAAADRLLWEYIIQ